MSRRDEPPEYDLFEVTAKLNDFNGEPVESRNGKSRLIIFHNILSGDGSTKEDVEIWVPKKISKIKKQSDESIVLRVPTWWVKTKEELS